MNQKALGILALVLAGGIVEGVIVLLWVGAIPTCGCQNIDGQPYPWCPQPPCPATEALNIESSKLNSPTNVTLKIINTGITQVSLVAYYVKDPQNNEYSNTNWSGPTIVRNALMTINILIDGKAFTFQSGTSYAVEVVTSRNNQYTFTITA